ncbi:MAG: T9SS type A sorting domain-containing protein [Bacteroidota bacterium]
MLRLTIFIFLFLSLSGDAQTLFCAGDPPLNPHLAESPWPIYHRNNYAQSSTCLPGPLPGDSLRVVGRLDIQGGTSPWTYLSDIYPSGERVLFQSNATHFFKFIDTGEEILAVDSLRIDFDPIASFGWNFLLSGNASWFTYDPKYDPTDGQFTRLFKMADIDSADPYSEMLLLDTFDLGAIGVNRTQHFSINYDGHIVFWSENDEANAIATMGVLTQDFQLLDTLQLPTLPGEIVHHNAFPIAEDNSMYIVTTHRLIQFLWDGTDLSVGFEALYDFVADGPTGSFAEGSGTTPTLMGWGEGNDQLIVMADGHAQNNLLAFWRTLPDGWTGISGMALHFADSIALPGAQSISNIFQSIENSPTVYGYDVAIAQFNSFLGQPCPTEKGVQKIHWDTMNNAFELDWVNTDININGVLTYSSGSNLLYGSGKEEDCNYYYYGLDWETGDPLFRQLLGGEGTFVNNSYDDGGNNNIIDENGNIYFSGGSSLLKVETIAPVSSIQKPLQQQAFISPNPLREWGYLHTQMALPAKLEIWSIAGKRWVDETISGREISIYDLPEGVYLARIQNSQGTFMQKILILR